jgi:uncharacterized lipoprotein YmbA
MKLARIAVIVLLSACGHSPQPRLYTLRARPGGVVSSPSLLVEVRRPSLAGYLDRREIVRSVAAHELILEPRAIWAEPLDGVLGRVLAADLALRLPQSQVFHELSNLSASPALRVEVAIDGFDQREGDSLELRALVLVQRHGDRRAAPQRVALRGRIEGTSTSALVQAWEELLGRLADELARMLAEHGNSERRAAPAGPQPSTRTDEASPNMLGTGASDESRNPRHRCGRSGARLLAARVRV